VQINVPPGSIGFEATHNLVAFDLLAYLDNRTIIREVLSVQSQGFRNAQPTGAAEDIKQALPFFIARGYKILNP